MHFHSWWNNPSRLGPNTLIHRLVTNVQETQTGDVFQHGPVPGLHRLHSVQQQWSIGISHWKARQFNVLSLAGSWWPNNLQIWKSSLQDEGNTLKHHESSYILTRSEINISPGQVLFSVHMQFTQLRAWLPFWPFSATCCLLPSFVPFNDLRFGAVHVFCARRERLTRPMPTGSFPSALHRDLRSLVDSQWHLPVKPPLKLRDWELLSPGDKWHTAMAPSLDRALVLHEISRPKWCIICSKSVRVLKRNHKHLELE